MGSRGPSLAEVQALQAAGDVAGLLGAYAATTRRDRRREILAALAALGEGGRSRLLELLGDEPLQKTAGAALAELGEEDFPAVAAQLDADDELRRRGALLTVYYYARYRDLPAAHELLAAVAAGDSAADLTEPAAAMAAKVERLTAARNAEIDRQLARIKASVERDRADGGNVALRMYANIHSGRMEAMNAIVGMRYAGLRHVIDVAPEVGESAVAVIMALALNEVGGGVMPTVAAALQHGDKRTRSLMLTTLLCLRRAKVPGAGEALDEAGIKVTDDMDRRAAFLYRQWVKER